MISIRDIARESGVSVSTVSRVLNESPKVSKEKRAKVLKVIKKLNYRPSSVARSMVNRRSNLIGLIIPYIQAPFFDGLVTSVESTANKLGFNLLLCHTHDDIRIEREYLNIMIERRVDGVLVLPISKEWEHIRNASKAMPLVLISRRSPFSDISTVRADDIAGSYQVMKHLLDKGHRTIHIISSHEYISTASDRLEGAMMAINEFGLPKESVSITYGDMTYSGGIEATEMMFNEAHLPSAIYAVNQTMVMGVARTLLDRGYKIPGDFAVAAFAGFDDYEFHSLIRPQITANIYPTIDTGVAATNLLFEQIKITQSDRKKTAQEPGFNAREILFKPTLAVRESTSTKGS